jgi:hypothetical protein
VAGGLTEMDQLQQLVETLRVLARTQEPNRVALVEKAIDKYLNDKAGIVRLSLERRRSANKRDEIAPPHGAYPKAKDHGQV